MIAQGRPPADRSNQSAARWWLTCLCILALFGSLTGLYIAGREYPLGPLLDTPTLLLTFGVPALTSLVVAALYSALARRQHD